MPMVSQNRLASGHETSVPLRGPSYRAWGNAFPSQSRSSDITLSHATVRAAGLSPLKVELAGQDITKLL